MIIVDSHAHLYFDRFDGDRAAMIDRARAAGVVAFVTVGTDVPSSMACLELARLHQDVFPTVGIHPNDSGLATAEDWAAIERLAADPRCVAIGETGLDYYRDRTARDIQQAAFRRQIALARATNRPVIIHCREAFDDTYAIVAESPGMTGVMHCFSGDVAGARRAVDLGLYVSFAGPLTYKKNEDLRAAAAAVPKDRLLIETDCPFLPPEGQRGKRNEPGFLPALVDALARVIGRTPDDTARLTAENASRLFALPLRL